MVTFSTEGEHLNLHLRIHDHEEVEDTILAAHPPLHRGCFPPWGALDGKNAGGNMNWTPGEPSCAYWRWSWHSFISLNGLFEYIPGYWEWPEDVLSRCSIKLSTAAIYEAMHASPFIYEYSDPLMKAFCGVLESVH
ncbi:hypothetical protein LIER_32394 [Lithospermum erythrorhizon]|uniref:Uncharacterized protein n=1 Tax=Lithospermum erythrorhizon TaxID=34254 RepID=A0AAV3RTQ2_LITER